MSNTDILIIGAGPAGTAAAIMARNAGLHATIIERLAFPRIRQLPDYGRGRVPRIQTEPAR